MRKILMGLAVSAALVLATPSNAATQTVRGVGFSFVAPVVVAGTGDTIKLEAIFLPHSFTTLEALCDNPSSTEPKACETGDVTQGGTPGSVVLQAAPGTYDFFCRFHKVFGMVGKLRVL